MKAVIGVLALLFVVAYATLGVDVSQPVSVYVFLWVFSLQMNS